MNSIGVFSLLSVAALLLRGVTAALAANDMHFSGPQAVSGWLYTDNHSPAIMAQDDSDTAEDVSSREDSGNRPRNKTVPDVEQPGVESVRRYITREEKLEAGRRRGITDWLYASTLTEVEWHRERMRGHTDTETDRSVVLTLQGGLKLIPTDFLQADIVLEYDSEADDTVIDELVGEVQWGPFELEVGKQGLPFGEYFSRFATSPLIEFGETTETAVKLSYGLGGLAELSLAVYEGRATRASGNGSKLDYAAAIESQPVERLALGLSQISDLADSDERLLVDTGNQFLNKVSALGGYAFWTGDNYELSMEYVSALDRFRELDEGVDKPSAWNIEFGFYPNDDLDFAFRLEGSNELEGAPTRQVGISTTWLLQQRATLTFELLYGRFKTGFFTDDEENAFYDVTTIGFLFSAAL